MSEIEPDADETSSEFDPDKVDALEKFRNQKHELYERIHETPLVEVKDEFGNANADKATHKVMLAAHKAYDLPEELLWSDQAIEELSTDEIRKITGKYFLMIQDFSVSAAQRADWVSDLYQKAKSTVSDTLSDETLADESEGLSLELTLQVKGQGGASLANQSASFNLLNPLTHNFYHTGDDEGIKREGSAANGIGVRIETFIISVIRDLDLEIDIEEKLLKYWEKYHSASDAN